ASRVRRSEKHLDPFRADLDGLFPSVLLDNRSPDSRFPLALATPIPTPADPRSRIWTPVELVRWTAGYLTEKGLPEARLTAELLLAATLDVRRLDLYLQFDRPLTPEELASFKGRLKRRLAREPLQYIEGFGHFRELRLQV